MDKQSVKDIEHFAYPVPFTYELKELDLQPYKTNTQLEEKIHYIFSHYGFIYRNTFIEVSESGSKGLVKDMAIRAVAIMRYYIQYPQQFGHKVENIHLQILIRMWKQVYRHKKFQRRETDKYLAVKMRLLLIENGFIEELIRTCECCDYIQHYKDMRKEPKPKKIKDGKPKGYRDGSNYFEYLCKLGEG